jgi:translation initiation factor IF-2
MMELKANPNRYAIGTVFESNLDKGEGPKATLLVQNGTLNASDYVVVGSIYGKIRRMSNEYGQVVHAAGPSSPVVVTGLSDVPSARRVIASWRSRRKRKRRISLKSGPFRRKTKRTLWQRGDDDGRSPESCDGWQNQTDQRDRQSRYRWFGPGLKGLA